MKHHLLFVVLISVSSFAFSQYQIDQSVSVENFSGIAMKYPWTGGLNNAQFSSVDLNGDGIDDLFIFDRTGNKIYTFLNHGTANTIDYTYAPEYEPRFPDLQNWALLVDYDCDGIKDIFTFTNFPATGIRVFRGSYDAGNTIQFTLKDSLLTYPNVVQNQTYDVNLYVSSADIPAVVDVNHDGDKDILTFQQAGGYVIYFENTSVESGHGCSDLNYELEDQCWGDFFESGFRREDSLNVPCPFFKWPGHDFGTYGEERGGLRHTGSTLLSFDNDGDQDVELITGDISFTNLVYLHNGGSLEDAHIDVQDTVYPSTDVSADIFIFPASFWVDVDNDGLNDLLVTPNWQLGAENYKCVWLYKNEGTPVTADFHFQKKTFLVDDMIDVGEGAQPVFFDVDNDGLLDILVGNYGYYEISGSSTYTGKIAYFRNIGDQSHPAYQMITDDYANISSLKVLSLRPAFADLDGDGDQDMITGRDDGTLLYFKNTADSGSAANFIFTSPNYAGIDVGNFSTPQLVDVNHDGLPDLLIGERDGNLNYYQNTGTAADPVFTLVTNFFGGVDVRQPGYLTGYSVPFLSEFEPGAGYTLLVGCERGFIFRYTNIDNNLTGTFTKTDSVYSGIKAGLRSSVFCADADNDGKLELLTGSYQGGVTYYNQAPNVMVNDVAPDQVLHVYPNPSSGFIHIDLPPEFTGTKLTAALSNDLGQQVFSMELDVSLSTSTMDISGIPSGIYFLCISDKNYRVVSKLVIYY